VVISRYCIVVLNTSLFFFFAWIVWKFIWIFSYLKYCAVLLLEKYIFGEIVKDIRDCLVATNSFDFKEVSLVWLAMLFLRVIFSQLRG